MFHFRRAAVRALTVASSTCTSNRLVAHRVTTIRITSRTPSIRAFSYLQPRFAGEPSTQEVAATQETTDAIPDGAESINSTPAEGASSEASNLEPDRFVYLGNMDFTLTPSQIEEMVAEHGEVVNLRCATEPSTGRFKGFAFIEFATQEQGRAAKKALDGSEFFGRTLRASATNDPFAKNRSKASQNHPPGKTVYIGNLSFDMTDKELNEVFRDIKGVLDVRVAIDRRTGQPRGFAHADFADVDSASAAKERLSGQVYHGRELKTDFAPSARFSAEKSG